MSKATKRPDLGRPTSAGGDTAGGHPSGSVLDRWLAAVDPVAAVRGMSSGFSVLVVGGLAAPVLARVPGLGAFSLVLTSLVAFIIAARRPGTSRVPRVHGATAALGAYLLVLPLVGLASRHWDVGQIAATGASALVVGAIVGEVVGRRGSVWTPL